MKIIRIWSTECKDTHNAVLICVYGKNGCILSCCYDALCEVRVESAMYIDEKGKKKYEAAHNDYHLNVHNAGLLTMWRENVNCQAIISRPGQY